MIEIFSNMISIEDGEFACMGTFTPAWVSHLGVRKLPDPDLRAIKRFLRHAVFGARGLMREYARIREVAEGDARPLRQLSIMQYVVEDVPSEKENKKKRTDVKVVGSAPPIGSWLPSVGGWGRVTWLGSSPCAPTCAPLTPVRQRQQALGECGFEGTVRGGPKEIVLKGQAGRGTKESGACDVEGGTEAAVAQRTGSPVRINETREPKKAASSSMMRTLFPDPRIGWDSNSRLQMLSNSAQPRGCNVLHGLATGGAYCP